MFDVDGNLGLSCVLTSENDGDGIFIQVDHDFYIKCSQSTDNSGDGLQIVDAPTAQLLSFTATGNGLLDINYDPNDTTLTEKQVDCSGKTTKSKPKSKPDLDDGLFTKLYCLPGEIKVALYDTYGDKIEFNNLCGYEAAVFDPDSWAYPGTIPGGGDDYITSLQNKMLEEMPSLELNSANTVWLEYSPRSWMNCPLCFQTGITTPPLSSPLYWMKASIWIPSPRNPD